MTRYQRTTTIKYLGTRVRAFAEGGVVDPIGGHYSRTHEVDQDLCAVIAERTQGVYATEAEWSRGDSGIVVLRGEAQS